MTIKEAFNRIPKNVEEKIYNVSYLEDGLDFRLYWVDEDHYSHNMNLCYYDDGFYSITNKVFETAYPTDISNTLDKIDMQIAKELIESLGGTL